MSDEVIEALVCSYMKTEQPAYSFGWQGGEPTLMGVDFFRKVVELQKRYHLFPLDPTVYIISAIPVQVRGSDLLFVTFAAIALCLLASRYPAKRAAELVPVEAIRWE